MLRDLACIALGIGIYLMWTKFKRYRAAKAPKMPIRSMHLDIFDANPNPVETRMQFTKDQTIEILAEYTAARRGLRPGKWAFYGYFLISENGYVQNVRIELKKHNHDS